MLGTALLAIALFAAAAGLTVRALALPRLRAARQLEQIGRYGFAESIGSPIDDAPRSSIAEMVGRAVAGRIGRARRTAIRGQLIGAGLHGTSVEKYLGWYLLSGIGMTFFMVWFAASTGANPALATIELIVGAILGWFLAPVYLSRRGRMRLEQIDQEIPELVDLLLVGVESGMAFHGSLRVSAPRIQGPLGDEVQLLLQQQALGASTAEALENMLERGDTPAVRSFVRTIVQGERHGVSIGNMLHSLADEMRKHRHTIAQEKAHKTPVKILFPLVFLLLPALLLLILTPAIMRMGEALSGI